jgi:hypothetical protein
MTDGFAVRKDLRQVGLLCSQEGLSSGQNENTRDASRQEGLRQDGCFASGRTSVRSRKHSVGASKRLPLPGSVPTMRLGQLTMIGARLRNRPSRSDLPLGLPADERESRDRPTCSRLPDASASVVISSPSTQRVLRAAVRAFRPTGLFDGQEHARMRVPQMHARHRAGQRQIRSRHRVLVAGVRLQKFRAGFVRAHRKAPQEGRNYGRKDNDGCFASGRTCVKWDCFAVKKD